MSASNGASVPDEIEVSPAVFAELGEIEREFANVELDALRQKEHALVPLYARRSKVLQSIPSFWPQVLFNGPQEFQQILSITDIEDPDNIDVKIISAIKNLTVERYGIKSVTEGEPRSLRFVFEFNKNDIFEDTKVVKDFEFVTFEDDETGALVSKPVTFKWTKKGKKLIQAKTNGLLDLASDLYKAEEAAKINLKGQDGKKAGEIGMVEREGLWQYEKLREKLEEVEDEDADFDGCWLDWFGYRGPVAMDKTVSSPKNKDTEKKNKKGKNGNGVKSADEDEDDFEDFDDEDENEDDAIGLLDVEIFPNGEEVAISLAEDLWANAMDYFMASQEPDEDELDGMDLEGEDDDSDDDEVPELIDVEELKVDEIVDTRPSKKQRTK